MRILYVAMRYDYGRPEQGYGFEHYNFYHSLLHMGHDILYFDFMTLMKKNGRDWMNQRLLEVAKAEKPTLMFTILFTDELDPEVVRKISENTETVTLNWFCDDHWRFDTYSRYWVPCFNWVVTTAASALPKYARLGFQNVIKSQWACNHFFYRKLELPLEYDVSFIGQPHGNRREIVQILQNAGINIRVWGTGWESGRLSQGDMIRVFNQSRINLNLSNASVPISGHGARVTNNLRRWISRSLDEIPFGSQLKQMGKRWLDATKRSAITVSKQIRSDSGIQQYLDQIKGRNFEIPGCGGFLLTGRAEDLGNYYEMDKEVVCFNDLDNLVEKVHYYLRHEDERAAIAQAGYQRTLREYTYAHRFNEIFEILRLPCKPFDVLMEETTRAGQTEEVE